jgi:hypothetical protein
MVEGIWRKKLSSINGFFNIKTELLSLLVIVDFPYDKLVKTMMFNIYHYWYFIYSCAQENTNNGKNSVFTMSMIVYMVNF